MTQDPLHNIQAEHEAEFFPFAPPRPRNAPRNVPRNVPRNDPRNAPRNDPRNDPPAPRNGPPAHEALGTTRQDLADDTSTDAPAMLVQSFGHYEAEYAAIRKGVGIFHEPQRGILQLTGSDVRDFLHRLTTQNANAMTGGQSVRAFQLNVKGRIEADMIIHHGDMNTWLDADRCDLPALARLYDGRLFTEDVTIENHSDQRTAVALHGPAALDLLRAVSDDGGDGAQRMFDMPGTHHVIRLNDAHVTAYRHDACGVPGVRLWLPSEQATDVYKRLANAVGGLTPDVDADAAGGGAKRAIRGRGIGWLAFNTARIEAGRPIYHVDFGPDTTPAETGPLFDEAVHLAKGCYLGQEIVARMHALGHPKRVLVGLAFDSDSTDPALPVAGSPVYQPADDGSTPTDVIGGITSSTLSPMSGGRAIALAMMKWGRHTADTPVVAPADGRFVTGSVRKLPFM